MKPRSSAEVQQHFDPEQDHYPSIKEVVGKVLGEEEFPTGDIDRLEISLHASGYATARVWPARADEPIGWTYANSGLPTEPPAGLT